MEYALQAIGSRAARALALGLVLVAASARAQAPAGAARGAPRFLSAPAAGDAADVALGWLRASPQRAGLGAADLEGARLADRVETRHNGVTHLYLRQRLAGIEVQGGDLAISVARDGRVFALRSGFVRDLARAVNARSPKLSQEEAVRQAAVHLGVPITAPLATLRAARGPQREALLTGGGISSEPIPVKLAYLPDGQGGARLVWSLFVRMRAEPHWWNLSVDAVAGGVLAQTDWILDDSYRVFAFPQESPSEGERSLVVGPADATASPFGWHDTNGAAGAEFTDTRGNNATVQDDVDANNSGGARPNGGPGLDFDLPLDAAQAPSMWRPAAIANLYYWTNVLHDFHYRYGFDEASGNFQSNNYGRGGLGGDPVLGDAQDGGTLNNADMSRAVDGTSPRLQMYLWQYPGVLVLTPSGIAQAMRGGTAIFGPALTLGGITGSVVRALDAPDPPLSSTTDACSPLTNAAQVAGKIALVDRGDCPFVTKVANAQSAGAIAVIVVNHLGDEVIDMGGTSGAISIPSVLIGKGHGQAIEAQLAGGVSAKLSSRVQRDGDLDAGIVIHEYGHGVSIRLSGGPANASCLSSVQGAGMGEGWSDFWALALTAKPGDAGSDPRPIGSYARGEGPLGPGLRSFPYTTNPALNPHSLGDLLGVTEEHAIGEVWAEALWELYWALVEAHGFDPDLASGGGGNGMALQLVMDALKLQGCEPSYVVARDAILEADLVDHGGANACRIWQAFAKRGFGVGASAGSDVNAAFVTEDFGVPIACEIVCGNGAVESGEGCDDGGTQAGDGCSPSCQPEPGFGCAGSPSVCAATCGDGLVLGGEGCDDGGTQAGDGCSASCQPEPGFGCAGSPSVCTATCGDGLVAGGEGCDDGGTQAGDGCGASCQPEPGFGCAGTPSVCAATCGDGLVLGGEGCDDGGTQAGDGCDAACEVEPGYGCSGAPSLCVPGAAVPALTREGLALLALALAATARFHRRGRRAPRARGEC